MVISRYQRWFGVGLVVFMVNIVLLFLLGFLGRKLAYSEFSGSSGFIRIFGFFLIGLWAGWHIRCLIALRAWLYDNKLCTSGPYRLVRHPLYAGVLLIANPGIALVFNSWIMLICPVILFPIVSVLVRKEEGIMTSVFGEDYARYASRTGRFFPRIMKNLS